MSNNKDIEQKYRDTFQGHVPEEIWNTPSDDLWASIETSINKSPSGYSLWPLVCFLLLGLGLGTAYFLYGDLQDAKQQLLQKEIELESCSQQQKAMGALQSGSAEQGIIATPVWATASTSKEEVAVHSKTSHLSESDQSVNVKNSAPSNITLSESNLKPTAKKAVTSLVFNIDNDNKGSSTTEQVLVPSVMSTYLIKKVITEVLPITVADIHAVTPTVASDVDHELPKVSLVEVPELDVQVDSKQPFYLTLSMLGSAGFLRHEGLQSGPTAELIDKEYGILSNSLAASVSRSLTPHLYVSGGLGYQHMKYRTEYDLNLEYNKDSEMHQGAEGLVSYAHSLPSFAGDLSTELILSRSLAAGLSDVEEVLLDFDTEIEMHQLSMPIGVDYYSLPFKSGFNIGIVLQPSLLVQSSSHISNVLSHHDHIGDTHSSSILDQKSLNSFLLHGGVRAGYSHQLTPGINVGLGVNYLRGLNNLYETTDYSSTSDILSVGLTLSTRI